MPSDSPKTPKQRKAEALDELVHNLDRINPDKDVLSCAKEYARACIDEAVAPALGMIQRLRDGDRFPSNADLDELRRLLTERAGT